MQSFNQYENENLQVATCRVSLSLVRPLNGDKINKAISNIKNLSTKLRRFILFIF